jgi:hypothetical protein
MEKQNQGLKKIKHICLGWRGFGLSNGLCTKVQEERQSSGILDLTGS